MILICFCLLCCSCSPWNNIFYLDSGKIVTKMVQSTAMIMLQSIIRVAMAAKVNFRTNTKMSLTIACNNSWEINIYDTKLVFFFCWRKKKMMLFTILTCNNFPHNFLYELKQYIEIMMLYFSYSLKLYLFNKHFLKCLKDCSHIWKWNHFIFVVIWHL